MKTDEKLLEARIRDAFVIAKKHREKRATNFLDPAEQEMALQVAGQFPDMDCFFDGGYEEAERKILVAFPEPALRDPLKDGIGALRISSKDPTEYPGHRDYMGSILGLGINREMLGDILVTGSSADVIIKEEIMEYIGLNLQRVGNVPMAVEEISVKEILQPERSYRELKSTVASLRIDAVAGIAFGISRSKMTPFIKGENLKLNFKIIKDPSTQVKEGDTISAHRLGRAKIAAIGGQSKKGRTYVTVYRYTSR